VYLKDLLKPVIITPPDIHDVHLGRNNHNCTRSLPSCQNTEDCRLWWNPTWNA